MKTISRFTLAGSAFVLLCFSIISLTVGESAGAATDRAQAQAIAFTGSLSASVGGTLYFSADDGRNGRELWKSDGTDASTFLVKDIRPGPTGSNPRLLTVVGSAVFFTANDGKHGPNLWETDGTTAGTHLVKDVARKKGSHPVNLVGARGELFFRVVFRDGHWDLWRSDGTEAGTVMVRRFPQGTYNGNRLLTGVGSLLFFRAGSRDAGSRKGSELWRSDGTPAGTRLVKDIWPGKGDSFPGIRNTYASWGGDLYFRAWTASHGTEPWRSDGTEAGTSMVADVIPGRFGSDPGPFIAFGGALFFAAGDAGSGQLWTTDGTQDGTVLVKDVLPGAVSLGIDALTEAGGTLFLSVEYEAHADLWRSDGTASGTSVVKDYPAGRFAGPISPTDVGGTLFFFANEKSYGEELWRSDGTEAGTLLVKDINPGQGSAVNPYSGELPLVDGAGTVYFAADDSIHGLELWKSDGTSAGTLTLKDINLGSKGSDPSDLLFVSA